MTVVARNIAELMKFRREPAATRYLPYSYHVTDKIISTVNGEYVVVFKLRGRAHETAPDSDLVRWVFDFNHLIRTIGDERVRIWTHEHRRQASEFEQAEFNLHFAKTFNAKYTKKFENKPLMVNDLYLSIVFHPLGDVTQQVLSKVERPSAEEQDVMRDEAISIVEDIASQVKGALRPYGIEQLGIYYRDEHGSIINNDDVRIQSEELAELESGSLDDADDDFLDVDTQGVAEPKKIRKYSYSTALEFLGFLCNGTWEPVPVCRNRIRSYLMNVRPVSSKWGDVIQLRGIDSVKYTCGLELREYSDDETEPGQLNILKEADFEYVLTQSFSCMSVQAAGGLLSRQEKALMEVKDAGKSQINAMERAKDDVKSRRFVMGFHHCTLHVFGKTSQEAQKHARQAKVLMNQCGIIAHSVGLASEAAFYARLPGNQQFIPRPTAINSWNFICFSSFHNFITGKPANNPWGPAVTILTGLGGGPVFFNWHVSPLNADWYGKRPAGHTLILGKTGAGKTTTLDGLITESSKFNPRGFYFDKDQGMMPMVTALEGKYQVLREGEASGMQPLQMNPTKTNVGMVKRLLRTCVEITNNGPIQPLEVEQLNEAVEHVMASGVVPLELRSVTAVARQLPRPARTSSAQRVSLAELIAPWCWGGEHGWALDNPSDLLDLSTHRTFGFDLTEFIAADDQPAPPARTPLLMYLFARVRQSIDGSDRTMLVFDEFHQYLDDPFIDLEIKRGLKTDRKKDAIYIFATQEPNDALESRIGKTVMQQCVTKILLENPEASPDDYINGLKLTQAEFDAMLAIPANSRFFLYKQGGQSTICRMDLTGLDDEIKVLSGTPDNAERLNAIIDELKTRDPKRWLPRFYAEAV